MGHVLSSILIGTIGIAAGSALGKLKAIEGIRGDITVSGGYGAEERDTATYIYTAADTWIHQTRDLLRSGHCLSFSCSGRASRLFRF